MEQNNTKLPLLLIAIAFIVLVIGVLSYLFLLKPYQEKKRIEAEKTNLEEIYKNSFGDLPSPEKPLEELTGDERKYKEAEISYQNCFDKIEKLNKPIGGIITNEYRVEWGGDTMGGWEMRFSEWLIKKHPEVCNEFDIQKINFFLDKKRAELGNNFDSGN